MPKIKKNISSFLLGEEGKISKHSILSMGLILGSAALTTILSSDDAAAGWHNSHGNHSSHSSHSSHNQHSNSLSAVYNLADQELVGTHTHHSNAT